MCFPFKFTPEDHFQNEIFIECSFHFWIENSHDINFTAPHAHDFIETQPFPIHQNPILLERGEVHFIKTQPFPDTSKSYFVDGGEGFRVEQTRILKTQQVG
jgi:hypothetical protein